MLVRLLIIRIALYAVFLSFLFGLQWVIASSARSYFSLACSELVWIGLPTFAVSIVFTLPCKTMKRKIARVIGFLLIVSLAWPAIFASASMVAFVVFFQLAYAICFTLSDHLVQSYD
jgi:hypothetical protein